MFTGVVGQTSSMGMLPSPRTELIGRNDELAAVNDLVAERVPVITIVGAGGAGKTRLATALARHAVETFSGQVWFVPLAGIIEPAVVPAAIAAALQVRASADRSLDVAVCDFLRHRSSLLVLDNFEQILDAAPFVGFLVEQCPLLTVIVTSRSPLRIAVERVFDLPPLSVATRNAAGVVLFCERAKAVNPDFALTPENEKSVLELCARVDGLPLGIELAASRSPMLTPAELLERFDRAGSSALRLLSNGSRDLPKRHRSIEDTISWSFDLLTPDGQRLLLMLSVFEAGCTLDAVEAVCGTDHDLLLLDRLSTLVDLRLVVVDHGTSSRFRLLETIREFARDRLFRDEAEATAVHERHCEYFRSMALVAQGALESRDDGRWIARFEAEYLNLRASFAELERQDRTQDMVQMATALGWFWRHSGRGVEGRERIKTAYERLRASSSGVAVDPSIEANCLVMIGRLSADSGLIGQGRRGAEETMRFLDDGLELARQVGDPISLIRALESMVTGLVQHEHSDRAAALCDEAIGLSVAIGHWWWHAMSLYSVTIISQADGDLETALQTAEDGRSIAVEHDDSRLAAIGTLLIGTTNMFSNRSHDAEVTLKAAYTASLAEGDRRSAAFAAVSLSPVFWGRRELAEAARWTRDGLTLAQAVSEWRCVGLGLTNMTYLAEFSGLHAAAARFYGAMRGDFESFYRAMPPAEQRYVERLAGRIRRALGDAEFEANATAGASLMQNLAIEEALRVADLIVESNAPTFDDASGAAYGRQLSVDDSTVANPMRALNGPTSREADILVRVAEGLTNLEIAAELYLSVATVERHLVNLYRKIGVRRRTEAAVYAVTHGLVRGS